MQNIESADRVKPRDRIRRFFASIKSFFFLEPRSVETYPLFYVQYSIRRDNLCESDLEFLEGQIPPTMWPTLLTQEIPMPPEIPAEYTYMVNHWSEGRLQRQEVSKIQVICVEKKILASTSWPRSTPEV